MTGSDFANFVSLQVVMGDDTWMQLAKDAFAEAHPYPSFDVHDLHTVDDGVWEVR
jgi:phosphatidylinositol glycan class O